MRNFFCHALGRKIWLIILKSSHRQPLQYYFQISQKWVLFLHCLRVEVYFPGYRKNSAFLSRTKFTYGLKFNNEITLTKQRNRNFSILCTFSPILHSLLIDVNKYYRCPINYLIKITWRSLKVIWHKVVNLKSAHGKL